MLVHFVSDETEGEEPKVGPILIDRKRDLHLQVCYAAACRCWEIFFLDKSCCWELISRDVNGYVLDGFNLHVWADGYIYCVLLLLPVLCIVSSDRCQGSRDIE